MNRALLIVGLFTLGACSCSKSHGTDMGVDGNASDVWYLDAPTDEGVDGEMAIDSDRSDRSDAPGSCDGIDVSWGHATEMPANADSRVVLSTEGRVSVIGSGLATHMTLLIYNTDSAEWSESALQGALNTTGTVLRSGQILIGGDTGRIARDIPERGSIDFSRLLSPETGEVRDTMRLHTSRGYHGAVLLNDGRVLIVGGWHSRRIDGEFRGHALSSCESFDPSTEMWTEEANMNTGRWAFSLTKLVDGRVLAVGGFDGSGPSAARQASAEIYDPSTGVWAAAASLLEGRAWHEAQLLPSGRVLVVGGENQAGQVLASTEIYDPDSNTWMSGPSLPEGAEDMASMVLPSGRILVAGGFGRSMTSTMSSIDQVNLYDESIDCWQALDSLNTARWHFGLTRLPDGRIMAPGGWTDRGPTASVEVSSVALD